MIFSHTQKNTILPKLQIFVTIPITIHKLGYDLNHPAVLLKNGQIVLLDKGLKIQQDCVLGTPKM